MNRAKWTGQRVQEVPTSFINSLSLASTHWGRKGPDKAERKVREEPSGLRFRTGAEEEETDEEEEGSVNHVTVKGLEGDKGGR